MRFIKFVLVNGGRGNQYFAALEALTLSRSGYLVIVVLGVSKSRPDTNGRLLLPEVINFLRRENIPVLPERFNVFSWMMTKLGLIENRWNDPSFYRNHMLPNLKLFVQRFRFFSVIPSCRRFKVTHLRGYRECNTSRANAEKYNESALAQLADVMVTDSPSELTNRRWCSEIKINPRVGFGLCEDEDDFLTCASAKKLIVISSTFSWWAAILGEVPNVLVVDSEYRVNYPMDVG